MKSNGRDRLDEQFFESIAIEFILGPLDLTSPSAVDYPISSQLYTGLTDPTQTNDSHL